MTTIKPISVPTKGIGILFQIVALNFPMNPESVTFYWQVFEANEGNFGSQVLEGNLTMDKETYSRWNNDDNFVIEWACNLLNFEIV